VDPTNYNAYLSSSENDKEYDMSGTAADEYVMSKNTMVLPE